MSDEELAEKYADTVKCEWENDTYWVDCRDEVTDAFIAGRQSNNKRITDLEKEIEELKKEVLIKNKLKKYAKLLQDICTVMGGDIYMVSVGLENRVKVLWDASEEKEGLKMVKSIENRLLKIKPQDWAEIEKW